MTEAARIWVDADACPNVIKQILCRAAERTGIAVTFVANQYINVPSLPNVRAVQVAQGYDVADQTIIDQIGAGDLVISADIPLADEAISKGATVLSPRGELLTGANIKARLNMRDFLDTMRSSGIQTGGPAPLNETDKRAFANQLDRYLARRSKGEMP